MPQRTFVEVTDTSPGIYFINTFINTFAMYILKYIN